MPTPLAIAVPQLGSRSGSQISDFYLPTSYGIPSGYLDNHKCTPQYTRITVILVMHATMTSGDTRRLELVARGKELFAHYRSRDRSFGASTPEPILNGLQPSTPQPGPY